VLQREHAEIDGAINEAVRTFPAWREREAVLTSVQGVGRTIARTLIARLPELGSLGRREVAALAGLAPWTRPSGEWKGRALWHVARFRAPCGVTAGPQSRPRPASLAASGRDLHRPA
jgi:transposase